MKGILLHLQNLTYAITLVYKVAPLISFLIVPLVILQGILPLGIIYLTKLIIDTLNNIVQNQNAVVANGVFSSDVHGLWLFIAAAAILAILSSIIDSSLNYLTSKQGMKLKEFMIERIQSCSILADMAIYESSDYHNTIYLAHRDAPDQPLKVVKALAELIQGTISLFAIGILLASFHWSLFLIAPFVSLFPFIISKFFISKRNVMLEKESASLERRTGYLHYVITSLTHAAEVRVMQFGNAIIKMHNELMRVLHQRKLQLTIATSFIEQLTHITALLIMYLCFGFMVWKTVLKEITIGDLVMYIQAFMRVQGTLQSITNSAVSLYESSLYLQAYRNLLEIKPKIINIAGSSLKKVPVKITYGINFKDVSFAYNESNKAILNKISLSIPANEITVFYGPNGSGKSTVAKLIARLYDPREGSILLDNLPIQEYDIDSLRNSIAILFQDFGRYHMSAVENIWLGNTELTKDDERIKITAKQTTADDIIRKLPKGYDTPLCNWLWDGSELSFGEWQKLAITRTLVKDAPIWILDEPFAFLDETGKDVLMNLCKKNKEGKCILIISHLKEIAMQADHLCIFKNGSIIAEGKSSLLNDIKTYF